MGRYTLKPGVGCHYEQVKTEDGVETTRKVEAGETIECSRNLAEVYPEKFEVAGEAQAAPAVAPAVAPKSTPKPRNKPAPKTEPAKQEEPTTTVAPTSADDVTAQFPVAANNGLIVRGTEANGYNFYERDVPGEAINPVPLDKATLEAELLSYTA